MSAKTRIVVLHMKKLVFAGIVTGLGILLVIFLGILLGSSHKQSADNEAVETMTDICLEIKKFIIRGA